MLAKLLKYQWIAVLLIAVLGGGFCMDFGHEWGDDFALYLNQAQCWVTGGMDVLGASNKECMELSDGLLGPYLYPQGFPLFLSFFIRVFQLVGVEGLPMISALKWSNYLVFILILVVYLKSLNLEFKGHWGKIFLTFVLVAWHPKFWEAADRLTSDLWFTGLVILFFHALSMDFKGLWSRILTLSLLVLLATATRSNGFFLFGAWVVYEWMEWRRTTFKDPMLLSLSMGGIASLLALYADSGNGSNHWHLLSEISIETIVKNFGVYFEMAGSYPFWHLATFLKLFAAPLVWLGALVFWVLVFIGFGYSSKVWRAAGVFVILNLALYIVWPSVQGMRFLFPLMPVLLIYFVYGLAWIRQLILKNLHDKSRGMFHKSKLIIGNSRNLVLFAALLIFIQGMATSVFYSRLDTNQAYSKSAVELYEFVSNSVNADEKVSFHKPRLLHYTTGIEAYKIGMDMDSGAVRMLKEAKIDYWVLRKDDIGIMSEPIFPVVFRNQEFVVFRFRENNH